MARTVVAALVGGILMFAWGAFSHVLLPYSSEALHPVPEREGRLLALLQQTLPTDGVYVLPAEELLSSAGAETEAGADPVPAAQGPGAFLVYHAGPGAQFGAKTLGMELASNVLASLLVALILGAMQTGFFGRLITATLIGAVGWLSICASYWTWYSFPLDFTQAELIDQLGGWFCAGIGLAAIVRSSDAPRR